MLDSVFWFSGVCFALFFFPFEFDSGGFSFSQPNYMATVGMKEDDMRSMAVVVVDMTVMMS